MREPMPNYQDADDGVYEFVCVRCGVTEFLTLTSGNQIPRCHCGFPLWPIALAEDASARRDACGEALLEEFCKESEPFDGRHEGLSLVRGRGGDPEEASDEAPEFGPLDHPHAEPHCQFCAIRQQRPSQHRLWCAVFFLRECNCGYERR